MALFLTIFVLLFIIVAPFGIKLFLDQSVRKAEITSYKVTKLNFASTLVIQGYIKNSGKIDFKECQVSADIIKSDKNSYKNSLYRLLPILSKNIIIDKNITQEDKMPFKIIIDNFRYKGDYNVSLSGVCY